MFVLKPLVYLQLLIISVNSELTPLKSPESFLQKCIKQIQLDFFKPTDFIIFVNVNEQLQNLKMIYPAVTQTDYLKELIWFDLKKVDAYIIATPEGMLKIVLNVLIRTMHWNPRAKFLVVVKRNVQDLFKSFRKYYVLNIIILLVRTEANVDIFTYFPYNFALPEEKRNQPVLLDVCTEGRLRSLANLFPNKLPRSWKNTTLKVLMLDYPPYVMCHDCSETERRGIEIDIFKMVQSILGFEVTYFTKPPKEWGVKLDNDSYSGAYGYLQNYEADVGIGLFYANFTESWNFDLSFPYVEDSSNWIVPAAKRLPHWMKIISIFKWYLWTLLGVVLLLTFLILYFAATHLPERKLYQNFYACFFACYQSLLSQTAYFVSRTITVRIIFASWIYFSFIITTALQSRLTSALNFDIYEKQISNVEELVESGMKFGFYGPSAYLFSNADNKEDEYIYHHYTLCPMGNYCLNRTAFAGDFATIKAKKFVQYTTSRYYLDEDGRPMTYIFENSNVMNVLVTMAFSKGFPMLDTVNRLLINIKSSGLVQYYVTKGDYYMKKDQEAARRIRSTVDVLSLDEMEGMFILLLVGWVVSFVAFVIEYLMKLYN